MFAKMTPNEINTACYRACDVVFRHPQKRLKL